MQFFSSLMGLLPILIHGVEAIHGPGNGANKKQIVMTAATQIAGAVLPQDKIEQVQGGLSALIDGIVGVLNASGALQKAPQVP